MARLGILTRRSVLGSLLGLVAGLAVAPGMLRADAAVPAEGWRLAATAATVGRAARFAALGVRVRHALGAARSDALVRRQERRLAADLANPPVPGRERLAALIAEDYRAERTVVVRGWILSEMEAAVCLAAADRWAPPAGQGRAMV